jgi:hypothetical protein
MIDSGGGIWELSVVTISACEGLGVSGSNEKVYYLYFILFLPFVQGLVITLRVVYASGCFTPAPALPNP